MAITFFKSNTGDYQTLEYLQSDGSQYIKTGIVPTLNTGYKTEFMITTMTDNPSPMAAQTSGSDGRFGFIVGTASENRRLWFGKNGWTAASPDVACSANTKYIVSYNFQNNGRAIQQNVYDMDLSGRTSVAQYELPIFTDCIAGDYNNSSVRFIGRIYRFKSYYGR